MNNLPLKGKVAFVTGAASKRGIGHSVVLRLAKDGADIVAIDRSMAHKSLFPGDEDWEGLKSVVKEVESLGRRAIALEAPVEDYGKVDAAVEKAVRELGKIDILVHCAGIRGPVNQPIIDFNEKDWYDVFKVNVLGAFNVSKAVARQMIKQGSGGKIVHIVSLAAKVPTPGSAIYNSSKAAQLMMVKILALELAPYNIDVYAINPGAVATNFRDEYFEKLSKEKGIPVEKLREDEWRRVASQIPKGRLGKPEEVAELVSFLVSDKAEYLTGAIIDITGGIIA